MDSNTHTLDPRRWIVLAVLSLAQIMVVLDATVVNVALPSIQVDLGFASSDLQWVVNGYTLAFGGFLLLGGRAADLFGRRRVFLVGLALFTVASFAGGLAQSEAWLIAARTVQGLGAAILSPAALSIVTTAFREPAERNRALGIWGGLAALGGTVGIVLGGVIVEYLGWQWTLFVNVPVGIGAAIATATLVRESRVEGQRGFDLSGALAATSGLVLLVYTLVDANSAGWTSMQTLGLGGLALALLAAFGLIEARHRTPLVPLGLFRIGSLRSANLAGALTAASFFGMFFFLTLYMQNVLGYSALETGFAYLPMGFAVIVTAALASQLVTRIGVKPVLAGGTALAVGALLLLTQISAGGSYLGDVLPAMLLFGVGGGFSFVPITISAVADVDPARAGVASGLINASQQVGGALGLAILTAAVTARTDDLAGSVAAPVALTEGFSRGFALAAGFAFANLLLALFLLRNHRGGAVLEAAPVPA